ncbi:nuclear transport factor 2 family protein [Streptomyces sp. SID10853]|uniref:nuclear transport factor 2 family protein n=1 Tax=Streptomyces sp. SID10853 TaxID=2706028 RepID=UPI0013BF37C7|nr:nuclear transport factor 2 family protein [Streptomyces sp. SID10853]NDZ79562.1 nuclear transport factor 2 family protein [Streptomyces sp. SID10853]
MQAFRKAVEADDHGAIEALLADDAVFTSPVVFKPYPGKAVTMAILRAVTRVFEDFHYVREINDVSGRDHVLVFDARVGDRSISGADFLHVNDEGLIDEFTVMVRPLSAAKALQAAMAEQFDRIAEEAAQA